MAKQPNAQTVSNFDNEQPELLLFRNVFTAIALVDDLMIPTQIRTPEEQYVKKKRKEKKKATSLRNF